jgi:hypothetical protein
VNWVDTEICVAINLVWVLWAQRVSTYVTGPGNNLGTWCNWADIPIFRSIDSEVHEVGSVHGPIVSNRSRSAILMDARASVEVCVKHFLLSAVAQKHVSPTFRCALLDVVDILCDWVYENVAHGDALRRGSVLLPNNRRHSKGAYILGNGISCDGRLPKAIRCIFLRHHKSS